MTLIDPRLTPLVPLLIQGEMGDEMFVVESGRLQVTVEGVGVVSTYAAGAYFGELALLEVST